MFSKPGQDAAPPPPARPTDIQPSPPPPQPSVPPPAARAPGRGDTPNSILGPELAIRGGIEGRGDIHLQGRAWGDVKVEGLLVGEQAELEGSVLANVVEVRGRVVGSITAGSVRLHPTARVDGDITYEILQVEPGAHFEGRAIRGKKAAAAPSKALDAKPAEVRAPETTPA